MFRTWYDLYISISLGNSLVSLFLLLHVVEYYYWQVNVRHSNQKANVDHLIDLILVSSIKWFYTCGKLTISHLGTPLCLVNTHMSKRYASRKIFLTQYHQNVCYLILSANHISAIYLNKTLQLKIAISCRYVHLYVHSSVRRNVQKCLYSTPQLLTLMCSWWLRDELWLRPILSDFYLTLTCF